VWRRACFHAALLMDHAQYIAELAKKDAALAAKDEALALAHQEIKLLKEKVDALIRRVFGVSSEKMDTAQLELLLNLAKKDDELGKASGCAAAVPLTQPEDDKPKKKKERKARMPEHLPVQEEVIVPPQVQANPQEWRRIGEEVSELLDYKPAEFFKRRTVRPTYVKRHDPDATPITAPLSPSLQERCTAAPGLLAQIVVAKYCDHLPLYRQEQIYKTRHGVEISRQTMAGWMGLVADWMKPIWQYIRTGVMGGGYVQVDESSGAR